MGMVMATVDVEAENSGQVVQVGGLGEVVLEVANPADESTVGFKNNGRFRPITLAVDGHNHHLEPGQEWRKAYHGEGPHPAEMWQVSFKNIHASIMFSVQNATGGANRGTCSCAAMWMP